ncbi:hypothetical protein Tco_0542416 [Tanacetum coccineum]
MRMEQYHQTQIWLVAKTAQALLQRQKERKAKSALLLAIPDEYQLRPRQAYDRFQKTYQPSLKFHDKLDIDDLYNNLKMFEADIKGSSGSSSNSQNVVILSTEDTNSINKVNTLPNGISAAARP